MGGLWQLSQGPRRAARRTADRRGRVLRLSTGVCNWIWGDVTVAPPAQPPNAAAGMPVVGALPPPNAGLLPITNPNAAFNGTLNSLVYSTVKSLPPVVDQQEDDVAPRAFNASMPGLPAQPGFNGSVKALPGASASYYASTNGSTSPRAEPGVVSPRPDSDAAVSSSRRSSLKGLMPSLAPIGRQSTNKVAPVKSTTPNLNARALLGPDAGAPLARQPTVGQNQLMHPQHNPYMQQQEEGGGWLQMLWRPTVQVMPAAPAPPAETASVPMLPRLVCLPGCCRMGPTSFLATCMAASRQLGDAKIFEKPAVQVRH